MPRRASIVLLAFTALSAADAQRRPTPAPARAPFDVVEAGIPQLQAALSEGRVTSRELVLLYLARIATFEETVNATMTVSRTALAEADALDRERAQGKVRGPLHGIPVALKDNIHTTNMPTTGGALAFAGLVPPYEATLTRNLREAGAIIIAKTVLTELANWVAGSPTPMPSNYSALGGYGMNPYDARPDPRAGSNDGRPALFTGGSSSGIGTSASFWAANVGTETSGSILSPANQNMLVGIKPTVGRISRWGVIPITADQDTPGPMARTVEDAAIMLGAIESAAPDANDPATSACTPPANRDYRPHLKRDALKGARIGIPRASFYEGVAGPGGQRRGGLNPEQAKAMAEAIAALKQEGAIIVDPANIPSVVTTDSARNFTAWGVCGGIEQRKGQDAGCSNVLKYGMKRDFNAWLATLGGATPIKTLTDLRYFNLANAPRGAIKYGQSLLDISDEMDVLADKARYEADRAKDIDLAGTHGIAEVVRAERLDALLFPGAGSAGIAARPGYPTVIVPFATIPNAPTVAFPRGFDAKPSPFGVSFTSVSCTEPRLIELAYAFEQATKRRVPPPLK
ncbi:MAG: amidase family protein [Gemmatimonadota bacterium]|nr:amidase family protein [Gemmatimonadota bacterium]